MTKLDRVTQEVSTEIMSQVARGMLLACSERWFTPPPHPWIQIRLFESWASSRIQIRPSNPKTSYEWGVAGSHRLRRLEQTRLHLTYKNKSIVFSKVLGRPACQNVFRSGSHTSLHSVRERYQKFPTLKPFSRGAGATIYFFAEEISLILFPRSPWHDWTWNVRFRDDWGGDSCI